MQDDEEKFANNPFRGLDSSRYPKVSKTSARKQGQHPAASQERNADSELFLRAVSRIPKTDVNKKKEYGFKLSEQCMLPQKNTHKNDASQKQTGQSLTPVEDDEDAKAFLLAMRKTEPLSGKGRKIAPVPQPRQFVAAREPDFGELLQQKLEFSLLYSDEYMEGRVSGLDDLLMNRLREGQMSPEAHLDLHGLNAEQAFEALRVFLRNCWFKGLRVGLVVTGRGRNSPQGQGVLRHKLQEWLTQEPFKRVVMAFCTALPHDGGPGSVYVLLRKYRKKGRIFWDKLAADPDLY